MGNHSGVYTEDTQLHLQMSSYEPMDATQVFEDVDDQFASIIKSLHYFHNSSVIMDVYNVCFYFLIFPERCLVALHIKQMKYSFSFVSFSYTPSTSISLNPNFRAF